jgi:hypothetical protein
MRQGLVVVLGLTILIVGATGAMASAPGPVGVIIGTDDNPLGANFIYPYNGAVNTTGNINFVVHVIPNASGFDRHEWKLYREGSVIDSGTVLDNLYLNFTRTGLVEGNYTMSDKLYDPYGFPSTCSVNFKVDKTAPSLSFISPTDGAYLNSSIKIMWTASDVVSGIDHYNVSMDGGTWHDNGVYDFVYSSTTPGSHTFKVRAYDNGGLYNESILHYTVDSVKPTVTMIAPADYAVFNSTGPHGFSWTGDGTGTSIVEYKLSQDGSLFTSLGLLDHFSNTFTPGNHTIIIRAEDQAGNTFDRIVHFTVDLYDPTVTIISPGFNEGFNTSSVTVSWEGHDNLTEMWYYEISTNNRDWTNVSTNTSCTLTDLGEGTVNFYVRGFDRAGHSSTDSITFNVDFTPPTVSILYPSEGQILMEPDLVVELLLSDAGSSTLDTVSLQYKYYRTGSADPGPWQDYNYYSYPYLNFPANPDGQFTLVFEAFDMAGNSAQAMVNFTIDLTPPSATITSPAEGQVTNDTTPTIEWTGVDEGSDIYYYEMSVDGGSWQNQSANLSVTLPSLDGGSHIVRVKAYDHAGRSSMATVNFTVDPTPPDFDIIQPANGDVCSDSTVMVTWTDITDEFSTVTSCEVRIRNATLLGVWVDVGTSTHAAWLTNTPEGSWTIDVRAYDAGGNARTQSRTILVDLEGPFVQITSPMDGAFTYINSVEWTAVDNITTVVSASYSLGGMDGLWRTVSIDGIFAIPGLAEGLNNLTLRVSDEAGHCGYANVSFIYDTSDPTISMIKPMNGEMIKTNHYVAEWEGTDTTSGVLRYKIVLKYEGEVRNEWYVTDDSTNLIDLPDGNYTIEVTAYDRAGNHASTSSHFMIDSTKPSIEITSPSDGSLISGTVVVQWASYDSMSAIDYYLVFVDGGDGVNVGKDSSFTFNPPDGSHSITVRALDHARNYADDTINIVIDNTIPDLLVISPANGTVVSISSVTLAWSGDGTGSQIDHYEVKMDGEEWEAVGTSTTYVFSTLTDGPHVLSVRAFDQAGLSTVASVNVTVDTTAPHLVSHTPVGENVSLTSSIMVMFSEAMNETATTITVSGISGSLIWSGNILVLKPSANLTTVTTYLVVVSGKDLAGHAMNYEWEFTTTNLLMVGGKVVDENGAPIQGAVISMNGTTVATTDAEGNYSFEILPGTYTLTVKREGYDEASKQVVVSDGQSGTGTNAVIVQLIKAKGSDLSMLLGGVAIIAVAILAIAFVAARRRASRKP